MLPKSFWKQTLKVKIINQHYYWLITSFSNQNKLIDFTFGVINGSMVQKKNLSDDGQQTALVSGFVDQQQLKSHNFF